MKVFLLLAMILPLALSTSKIVEMQVHTGTYPGSGIEFNGKKLLNFKAIFRFPHTLKTGDLKKRQLFFRNTNLGAHFMLTFLDKINF